MVSFEYVNARAMLNKNVQVTVKQSVFSAYEYFETPLSVTALRFLPVNNRLRNFGRIQFIAKSTSMYTKICLRHKRRTIWIS